MRFSVLTLLELMTAVAVAGAFYETPLLAMGAVGALAWRFCHRITWGRASPLAALGFVVGGPLATYVIELKSSAHERTLTPDSWGDLGLVAAEALARGMLVAGAVAAVATSVFADYWVDLRLAAIDFEPAQRARERRFTASKTLVTSVRKPAWGGAGLAVVVLQLVLMCGRTLYGVTVLAGCAWVILHYVTRGRCSPVAALVFVIVGPVLGVVLGLVVLYNRQHSRVNPPSLNWDEILTYFGEVAAVGMISAALAAAAATYIHRNVWVDRRL